MNNVVNKKPKRKERKLWSFRLKKSTTDLNDEIRSGANEKNPT